MPQFRTELWSGDGRNTGIEVPEDVVRSFGKGKRVPVVVTVNGSHRYRSTIAVMGGRYLLPFASEHREATGLGPGDTVDVLLDYDDAPRTVDPPEEIAAAIAEEPALGTAWAALSPSAQKKHAADIAAAKAADTRARRVEKTLAALREGG